MGFLRGLAARTSDPKRRSTNGEFEKTRQRLLRTVLRRERAGEDIARDRVVGTVASTEDGASLDIRIVHTAAGVILYSTHSLVRSPEKSIRSGGKVKNKGVTKTPKDFPPTR
jgi:hypothetical protein